MMFINLYANLEIHSDRLCVTGLGPKTMQNGHIVGMCLIKENISISTVDKYIECMWVFFKKSSTPILNRMTPFFRSLAPWEGPIWLHSKIYKILL